MRGVIIAFVLLMLAVSGCIGGDEADPADGEGEESSETTGTIQGQVVKDDFSPIANAEVFLLREGDVIQDTLTADDGGYKFEGIDPGVYRVRALATCCEDSMEQLRVEAGQVVEHNPELPIIPPVATFVDKYEWTGFVGCSVNYPTAFQPYTCPDENNNVEEIFEVEPGLKSVVVAMEWEVSPFATNESLRHWLMIPTDADRATIRYEDASPIEYRIDEGDPIDFPFEELEETTEYRFRIWGPSQGFQFTWQQEFTVHYHLFYGEPAPSGYKALPDL